MKAPSRAVGDAMLGVFAIVVLTACVLVVQRQDAPASVSTLTQGNETRVRPVATASPKATPTRAVSPFPSPDASEGPRAVVIAGPDLSQLGAELVAASGDTVLVAEGKGPQVLADGALETIDLRPAAVVFQVLAGSNTSVRTTDAVATVRKRWPGVRIVVVGPFGADDRKSAAAVKAAAEQARVVFLDPVELQWRDDAGKAAVNPEDFSVVAAKIAAALR